MRDPKLSGTVKVLAGAVLAVSLLLPLYTMPDARWRTASTYAADLARSDPGAAGMLAIAFLWPLPVLLLRRTVRRRAVTIALTVVEPLLAVFSGLLIWMDFTLAFGIQPIFPELPILWIPVSATPALGTWTALAANGLYLLAWTGTLAGAIPGRRCTRSTENRSSAPRWRGPGNSSRIRAT